MAAEERPRPEPHVQKLPTKGGAAGQDWSYDSGRGSPLTSYSALLTLAEVEELAGNLQEEDEQTKKQILKAIALLLVLKQGFEPDDLCTITELHDLLQKATGGLIRFLQTNQAHLPVIAALKHMPTNIAIQQISCRFLCLCAEKCESLYDDLVQCNFHRDLIKVIHDNITDPVIQQAGMKLFSVLLQSETVRDQLIEDNESEEVLQLIAVAIPAFRDEIEIQIAAAKALVLVLAYDRENQEQFMGKSMLMILEVLKASYHIDTQVHLLKVFQLLAENEKYMEDLIKSELHLFLMDLCKRYADKGDLMSVTLKLLSKIGEKEEIQALLITSGFVETSLIPLLGMLRTNGTVQSFGLRIISSLGAILFGDKIAEELLHMVVHIIYVAMFTHLDSAQIQIYGCRIMAQMLEYKQEANRWIGDDSVNKEDPVHSLCVGALLVFSKNQEVFVSACEAIYWIAADNDRLSTSLMAKNVHFAIIEGLKRFRKDCQAVESGCRALRGLCIFNDLHKNAIVMNDTFGLLVGLLKRHKDINAVQTEVISAIACLADVNLVRYQCFVQKVPENIISSMKAFSEDETLQETCLEALAVLATADEGADILISQGVGPCVLSAMRGFKNQPYIIKKALILLQMLACPALLKKRHFCKNTASLIYSAMVDYKDNQSLQMEAYVAMQLLAEAGKYMSELFVEEGCDEFLFEAINDTQKGTDIKEIAAECFFVLCQEQNQKSKMLLSACRKGMKAVVECLVEMGADVNSEEGGITPLYHAVCSGNDDIVKILLKYDVRELTLPLKKSLELELHYIAGLLLQKIGYDKDSLSIIWSSLGLEEVRVDWILTSLTSPLMPERDPEQEKPYLMKLRKSEQKRQKRKLVYSKSDPTSQSGRPRMRHASSASSTGYASDNDEQRAGPLSAMVSTIEPPPSYKIIRNINRSISVEGVVPTSVPIPVPKRRPTLPTIKAINSQSPDGEIPVFIMSSNEAEEYKKTTLTGANVPFNPNDPRQEPRDVQKIGASECIADFTEGHWERKRCRTPKDSQLLNSSSLSGDDFNPSAYAGRRKMSAPVVTAFKDPILLYRRKRSIDSISDLEETVSKLTTEALLSVDLSDNSILTVDSLASPTLQAHFEKMEKLDLSGNSLTEIPEALFQNLPRLQYFDIRCNSLKTFPSGVLQCPNLKELILSRNKVQDISLDHFNASIIKLDISYNKLTSIPSGIGNYFHSLRELIANNNHLMELPETPLGLKELTKLVVCHNQIDCIPEKLFHTCSKLEVLEASFNYISHLPSESVAALLPKLNKLKLRRNALATKSPFFIPKFILELPGLRSLDLSENSLTGLPAIALWKSTMLKELMFNNNNISVLNLEGAKTWNKLEKLQISHNYIKELPSDIGHLSSLSSFDISYNEGLTTLPDELGKCSKMWELQMDGLDLDLDRALMRRRVKDIIAYLHNRLKKAQRYYRMKLMVVGYGGRGKTTLLKSLMKLNNKSKRGRTKENCPTVGVDVRIWKYMRYERRLSDDIYSSWKTAGRSVQYTLSTWDFAGQEDFYSTHQCYLSTRATYLVVFDVRKGLADLVKLKIWLASIHSRAPGCPVIVVGTHKDKLPLDKTTAEKEANRLTEKLKEYRSLPGFPSIHGVFLVDATCENDDIDYLRNTIKYFVEEYRVRGKRVMGEKIPASYVQLSDLLAEEASSLQDSYPVIKQSRLLQIVGRARLDLDEEELHQAVNYLHESGVLLHYNDSTLQLRDFYFIDPGWLCKMMAQVITVKQINPFINTEGILRKKDVEFLFRGKATFPVSLIPQYLKLLVKFEIALPHSDTELLIPCKLPIERPDDIVLPENGSGKIKRIYQMPYVPIGLWFRLISRMITLTANKAFQALLSISDPVERKCWRKGLYIFWSKEQYFLLDSMEEGEQRDGDTEFIQIIVPSTSQGSRLFGQIVDHIDNLIDEWYPGLTSIDPILGHKVLEIEVPCPYCQDFDVRCNECHRFCWKDIQDMALATNAVECPKHGGSVPVSELAPDLVMNDLEPIFKLDLNEFEFEESSDKQLGDGGYGDVYTARYKGKEVAVKVFKKIAEIHPLTMLRQEAAILRCLNHPSIVSLVAVGIQPSVIVLELAPVGTLGAIVKKKRLEGKFLQQRIALQIAEGLVYLHKLMIIFRDVKPDNVLIFNLSHKASIHAKISDYGIARFSAFQGLKAQEGTMGYRAPEVIRKENYSFEADVFSYGLTMYSMLAKRHPFDHFESKGEMDRAIAEGLPAPLLEEMEIPRWPDMHAIIMQCLEHDPNNRPTASDIVKVMQSPDMLSLQTVVNVSKSTTVECFAVQMDLEERKVWLWIASGDSIHYQLSQFILSDPLTKNVTLSKGTNFKHGRIMCMQALHPHYLAIGTQFGRVWLYDTEENKLIHSSAQLQDSVLCMKLVVGQRDSDILEEGGLLLVGLANGKIAMFPVSELLKETNVDPICLYPGYEYEPVLCMARMGRRVFLSCGTQLIVLNSTSGISIEKIVEIDKDRSRTSAAINTLCVTKGAVLFSRMSSPVVEVWDSVKERIRDSFSIATLFGIPKTEARVTALAYSSKNNVIWVGTHSGHIGLVDFKKKEAITLTHRYVRSVRCLMCIKDFGFYKDPLILSGGLGFRNLPGQAVDKSTLCGCVAIWNANMADEVRNWIEYDNKRKELIDKKHANGKTS